jgi:hypothetical protein
LLDASRKTANIVAVHSEPFPWCCSEHRRFLSKASHRLGGVGILVRSAYITHLEARAVTQFNYSAPAELFPGKNKLRQLRYRRFSSAAEAVRYVIEDLPKDQVNASTLEVNEQRFNGAQIRELYNASAFPLDRAIAA